MMKVITASIALALAATGAQAQLPKDKEKLSEQCDKQAADTFCKRLGFFTFRRGAFGIRQLQKSL